MSVFGVTDGAPVEPLSPHATPAEWIAATGGRTFARGLYRIHTRESAAAADALVKAAYPEFADLISCFGYDWLGRQFATDRSRGNRADPEVLMLEPGTGEALEIPSPFSEFHDYMMVDSYEAVLARSFFVEWLESGGKPLTFTECIGYQQPLFLGGEDTIANLEVSDLDVYWTFMGQILLQVRGLPEGTRISGVTLEP